MLSSSYTGILQNSRVSDRKLCLVETFAAGKRKSDNKTDEEEKKKQIPPPPNSG